MCGIIGAIGESLHPAVSYELLTALLAKTETRGDDATGFWAAGLDDEGKNKVFFSKEPEKSTLFIKDNPVWKQWQDSRVNLLIAHCRKRTHHNGTEAVNVNNHPFLSKDGRIALIHNGNVPEFEMMKKEYTVKSDCDSEILLRIMESGMYYEDQYLRETLSDLKLDKNRTLKDLKADEPLPPWCSRMMGLRDVFARVNHGALAVAVGEIWPDDTRVLWLFRNKERPLHAVDLRDELGQIFFFSTPEIWRNALEASPAARKIVPQNNGIIEFPDMHIWMIADNRDKQFPNRKWKIVQKRKHDTSFDKERPKSSLAVLEQEPLQIVTNVNLETFEVAKDKNKSSGGLIKGPLLSEEHDDDTAVEGGPGDTDLKVGNMEEATLQPLLEITYKDEGEAKASFFKGDVWLWNGSRVTYYNFDAGQRVKLQFARMAPAIEVTIPTEINTSVKKKMMGKKEMERALEMATASCQVEPSYMDMGDPASYPVYP